MSIRNKQYLNVNQSAGWDETFKGTNTSKAYFADTEVKELTANNKKFHEIHYSGSTPISLAVLTPAFDAFPSGTVLYSYAPGDINTYRKTGLTTWCKVATTNVTT